MGRVKRLAARTGATHSSDTSIQPHRVFAQAADRVALIDSKGVILAVNRNWLDLAHKTKSLLSKVGPGCNYLEVCRQAGTSSVEAREILEGIERVIQGLGPSFETEYICDVDSRQMMYRMIVTPLPYAESRVAIVHTDVTPSTTETAEDVQHLRLVARRFLNAHEEDKRRISRELHDDLGNQLALLAFSIRHVADLVTSTSPVWKHDFKDMIDKVDDVARAIRNLSHDLHPALLQIAGLKSTIESLCEEFSRTRGIPVDVVLSENIPELGAEVNLTLFRIVQECLQNISKHSCATSVRITLKSGPHQTILKVMDNGFGFVEATAAQKGGLGLVSMRERAQCIGGHLEIRTEPGRGTEVRLRVPR